MPAGPARSIGPRIRVVSVALAIALGVLASFVAATLVWTSTQLKGGTATVARDTRSEAVATELELTLLSYQRLSNLHALTGEDALAQARSQLVGEMSQLLDVARHTVGSVSEQRLLDEIAVSVLGYPADRARLEASGLEMESLLRATQPTLDGILAQLESLRDLNRIQVAEAYSRSVRINELANFGGLLAGGALVLGLLLVVVGANRHVLRPVLALHRAILRLRSGELDARAPGGGLREVSELSRGFNEMAEALSQQRGRQLTFLAGVAHDLRNPLCTLRLGVRALAKEQSEARRSVLGARLDREVDRLGRMVGDLLDATRIEAGQLELRSELLDVRHLVDEALMLHGSASPNHPITAELPAEPACIRGDALRIQQVIGNLLSNAIKYSPDGGPVRIAVQQDTDQVVLAVSDRGMGIAPEELPDIFLPFCRRNADVAPGAGLGLSVVKRIVTAHDGSITVDSEPGVGSTFRVVLPRAPAMRGEQAVVAHSRS